MFICTEKERKGEDAKKERWVGKRRETSRKKRKRREKEKDKVVVTDWGLPGKGRDLPGNIPCVSPDESGEDAGAVGHDTPQADSS